MQYVSRALDVKRELSNQAKAAASVMKIASHWMYPNLNSVTPFGLHNTPVGLESSSFGTVLFRDLQAGSCTPPNVGIS